MRAPAKAAGPKLARDRALSEDVFSHFPYGIIVLGEGGELLSANPRARELLDGLPADRAETTCCEIFGCRSEDGPLADECLTAMARERSSVLPELRIDVRHRGHQSVAVWATAAPLGSSDPRVVVQLRPGDARDRRRRSVPHWVAGPRLEIGTFGDTRVESTEGPIGGRWLAGRAGQILKFLVCERHRVVHSDEIAEAIWPDTATSAAGALRYYIHVLRGRLEPDRKARGESAFVASRQGGYTLHLERVSVDADEFERSVRGGLTAFRRGTTGEATPLLVEAVEIYKGPFLADERYSQWVLAERDRLQALAAEALRALVSTHAQADDFAAAAEFADRLVPLQPFDMDVHRNVIAIALTRGRRSDAVRHYAALRQRMVEEFDEEPDFRLSDVSPDEATAV